ncbi:hypothetical protein N7492_001395 [Penicillium capsulatum]|uniref:Zn(2)-C6 fungal-type domain-containing protein n=1 Tax=Penicillium capsulatum TaxID=69766 RepID=A0A9W9IRI6_9EURO|nr:hypothetical protein N7492_001395 [Penicillium capsulatum]
MPRKPTPAGKQRVRTGCLTCDEQKPRCANCEVKGFSCKYGNDLAFVTPRAGQPGAGQAYHTITFVDDSPVAHAIAKNKLPAQGSENAPEGRIFNSTGSDYTIPHEHRSSIDLNDILTSDLPNDYPHQPTLPVSSVLLTGQEKISSSPSNEGYLGFSISHPKLNHKPVTANSCHETDLLRYFRYHVGPWIDTGDSNSAFGVQVLLRSRLNRPLQSAILALSAGQRSLSSCPLAEDIHSLLRFRKEAMDSLALQPDPVGRAGQALLLIQEILPAGLEKWRDLILPQIDAVTSLTALTEELDEALFWLYLRLDFTAAIMSKTPPIIPFRSFIQRDGTPIDAPQSPSEDSVKRVYKHALCLLGHCLALIFGDLDVSSPQTLDSPELAAFPSLRQSHFLSQWTFLWTDCQKWYNERPIDTQQIVDVRGGEADQIDPDHDSSFPILIYTTPMALVANAIYHVTSLLLLAHKPRLLKSLPGPRCFTSQIWHAQSIAGIAASNDSPAQWDPILVASLLLIGRDMTHESQQRVLLGRLKKITETTGINLGCETEALQSAWDIARYEEEPD